jgi:hypothetical protein
MDPKMLSEMRTIMQTIEDHSPCTDYNGITTQATLSRSPCYICIVTICTRVVFFLSTHIGSVFEKNNHLRALATSLQTSRQRRPLHMSATRIEWIDEWQRSLRTEWASRVECVGRGRGGYWISLGCAGLGWTLL